jgi:(p)ppGpp synthase/HD superfamily hydrolase
MNRKTSAPGSLERAIAIAADAHAGLPDKGGAPYILHPLRVMLAVEGELARTVAVLHDVMEDNPDWTSERLRAEGFGEDVIDALESVTKRPDEVPASGASPEDKTDKYLAFVRRAAAHPIGRIVKRADLDDNLDVSRLPVLKEKDLHRLNRYLAARRLLDDN